MVDHIIIYTTSTCTSRNTTVCLMATVTGYAVLLHLRYRNSMWNKETEIKYCLRTKICLRYPWFLQVLRLRMSQFFLGKIIVLHRKICDVDSVVNSKDFSRAKKEIKYFSRTLTEFDDISRRLRTMGDLLQAPYWSVRGALRYGYAKPLIVVKMPWNL